MVIVIRGTPDTCTINRLQTQASAALGHSDVVVMATRPSATWRTRRPQCLWSGQQVLAPP